MTNAISFHATVVEGDSTVLPLLAEYYSKKYGVVTRDNPDFSVFTTSILTIEHVREITVLASHAPLSDIPRMFVIVAAFLATEAQHALLKLFEEPKTNIQFVLVTSRIGALLPTLRSRMLSLAIQKNSIEVSHKQAQHFFSCSINERIAFIAQLLKKKEVEETGDMKIIVLGFLDSLEFVARTLFSPLRTTENYYGALTAISTAREYIFDRAPSYKLLLEQLALALPRA